MIDLQNGSVFKMKQNDDYASAVRNIRLPEERVVSVLKAIRDGFVLINRRIIAVNVNGITGKKRNFTSSLYSKIVVLSND